MKHLDNVLKGVVFGIVIACLLVISISIGLLDLCKPEKFSSNYTVRVISKKQILLIGVHDSFTMKFEHSVRINEFETVKIERP